MEVTITPIIPTYHFLIFVVSGCGFLLNLFTFHVIFKQTPQSMKGYSRFLILYQVFAIIMDFTFGIGVAPLFFVPLPCGYTTGLFKMVGIGTRAQTHLVLFTMVTYFCCFFPLLIYRQQAVLAVESVLKMSKRTFNCSLLYMFTVPNLVMQLTLFWAHDEQESVKLEYVKLYPETSQILSIPDLYILSPRGLIWISIGIGFQIFTAVFNSVFILSTTLYMLKCKYSHMSDRTRAMQMKVFMSMNNQIGIATLLMLLPVCVFMYISVTGKVQFTNVISDAIFIVFSSHGAGSSLSILLMYHPYRRYCWDIIRTLLFPNPSSIPGCVSITVQRRATMGNISIAFSSKVN